MAIRSGSYSFFDHAADVGIRVSAPTVETLFTAAGRALMEWIGPAPAGAPRPFAEVVVEGPDREELLVRWLQELLSLFHLEHAYFLDADPVEIGATFLRAVPCGCLWSESSSAEFQEVKAVTYHRIEVTENRGEWQAVFILDI